MLKESNFHKAAELLAIRRTLQYIAARPNADTNDWELVFRKPNGDTQTKISNEDAVEAALVALRAHLHTVERELHELGVELSDQNAEAA